MSKPIDYERICELARELRRPQSTLIALSPQNDPFYMIPSRRRDAEWFAKLWHTHGFGADTHTRRVHYRLVSQPTPVLLPDGTPYENTLACSAKLDSASCDARYMELIPAEHIVDRRNDEAEIRYSADETVAGSFLSNDDKQLHFSVQQQFFVSTLPDPPRLLVFKPTIPQPFMVEIWVEKSTMRDVIDPIARRYDVNVVTGAGHTSETRCRELIARASEIGKPVRVLYVSDFDPDGDNMPIGAARKMEFYILRDAPDLDVEVRAVALTKEQCKQHRLPRTPLKESHRAKAAWEDRQGGGATELDALEALHPGALRRILVEEIERYYDDTLNGRINETFAEVSGEFNEVNDEVLAEHQTEFDQVKKQHAALNELVAERLRAVEKEFAPRYRKLGRLMKTQWDETAQKLRDRAPDLDLVDWPEPQEADEDVDPLFDSTRGYLEQIDRYKEHQDKSTVRRKGVRGGTGWKVGRKRGPMSEEQKEARRRTWARKLGKEAAP